MIKYSPLHAFIAALALLIASCAEESNPLTEASSFTRIYDNNVFSESYKPIDIEQTADGGYVILGSRVLTQLTTTEQVDTAFRGTFLIKVAANGDFEKFQNLEETYLNPVPQLMKYQNSLYFFCMDKDSYTTQLIKVDEALEAIEPTLVNLRYPLAASLDGTTFIVLSYDDTDKLSVLSMLNPTGGILSSKGYSIGIGDDVEEPLMEHIRNQNKHFPFSTGRVPGGLYYFTGFIDYTFSLGFSDLNGDNPTGVVQGQQDDGGVSALVPLGGNKFAASWFNFGTTYFLPNVAFQTNSTTTIIDYPVYTLPEFVVNAKTTLIRSVIKEQNVIVYASDTQSRQVGLYFYDEATGAFLGSHYLGFSNPFEVGNMIQTADGGLAVCATTYVAGRFPRVCIFKLSEAELAKHVKFP